MSDSEKVSEKSMQGMFRCRGMHPESNPLPDDAPAEPSSAMTTKQLVRLIQFEHNYQFVPPLIRRDGREDLLHPRRTLRQLVCTMQVKISPDQPEKLPEAEIKRHVRFADLITRRLRRFVASTRRFLDFSPMTHLQEAIVEQLAMEMFCLPRYYSGVQAGQVSGKRYLVLYRPGTQPNPYEIMAREGINDIKLEVFFEDENDRGMENQPEADPEKEPKKEPGMEPDTEKKPEIFGLGSMCVRNVLWRPPTRAHQLQLTGQSAQDARLLGRKILAEFNGRWKAGIQG